MILNAGKEMVDYIADYLEDIRERRVFPDVKPGYIRDLVPEQAPEMGEDWDTIFGDVERVIMPGVSVDYAPTLKQNWAVSPNWKQWINVVMEMEYAKRSVYQNSHASKKKIIK